MKLRTSVLTWLLLLGPLQGTTLSLLPSLQTVVLGQPVTEEVIMSGFTSHPPSVGAFDLSVSFDETILSPSAITFGLFLGDPASEALTGVSMSPGLIEFAEVSLLQSHTLDNLQPASFSLATLEFATLTVGTSPLTFSQTTVDDAFGEKLTV